MDVTRRQFIRCTAAAAMVGWPIELRRQPRGGSSRPGPFTSGCAVLDLGDDCRLRESLSGYRSTLATPAASWTHPNARSLSRCAVLIVPGAMRIRTSAAQLIERCLGCGTTVILESGAAFADEEYDLSEHCRMLHERLGLRLGSPVALWPGGASSRGLPYVDYTWPTAARVRDFSRAIPVAESDGGAEVIARIGGIPVASKRRLGAGLLIFLGSPLGPALWTEDPDARRWLAAVVSGAHGFPRPR